MDKDIVIGKEWLDVNITTIELKNLSTEWHTIIDMSEESLQKFKDKGSVVGIVESLTMLIEYNKKARLFEDKVNVMNDAQSEEIIWS